MNLKKRWAALLLAGVLAAGLATPVLAGEKTAAAVGDQAIQAAGQYGGAVSIQYALWEDGEITASGALGNYSRSENRILSTDILYGIGSVSKLYTTVAVLQLAEAGKVELDKPVTDYLPDFKMADERYRDITVRMLLNHSSGLMGSTLSSAFLFGDGDDRTAVDGLLPALAEQRLKADPGAYSVYCNDGFTLAQILVEQISGQDFGAYIHEHLLTPAALEDTYVPGDEFDQSRLAKTYLGDSTEALPAETVTAVGTGGIYATASDLASFGGALTGGVLLKEDSRAAMTAPEYKNGLWPAEGADSLSYGLGWDAVEVPALMTYEGVTMALAKGGDTQLYHASLVVLPEQKLSCAVVSSGGSSIYNQSAAETILAAVLEERGYTPIMLEGMAAAPERAALTAAQVEAWAGHYGSSSMDAAVSLTADGTLTLTYHPLYGLPEQTFTYCSDGAFYDAGRTVSLRFVQEGEQIYLWQQGVTELPGLGNLYTSSYFLQKLPDNPIDENVASAWAARAGKLYLLLNERYTSQVYAFSIPGTSLIAPEDGYILSMRVAGTDKLESAVQIPGTAGRDCTDLTCYTEDGREYLAGMGALYVESAAAVPLYAGAGAYTTIQADGFARWYQTGTAGGKTLTVKLPEYGAFYVYDQSGQAVGGYPAFGDTAVTLPENGWIVFAGEPGSRFYLGLETE